MFFWFFLCTWYYGYRRTVLSFEQGLMILLDNSVSKCCVVYSLLYRILHKRIHNKSTKVEFGHKPASHAVGSTVTHIDRARSHFDVSRCNIATPLICSLLSHSSTTISPLVSVFTLAAGVQLNGSPDTARPHIFAGVLQSMSLSTYVSVDRVPWCEFPLIHGLSRNVDYRRWHVRSPAYNICTQRGACVSGTKHNETHVPWRSEGAFT